MVAALLGTEFGVDELWSDAIAIWSCRVDT